MEIIKAHFMEEGKLKKKDFFLLLLFLEMRLNILK